MGGADPVGTATSPWSGDSATHGPPPFSALPSVRVCASKCASNTDDSRSERGIRKLARQPSSAASIYRLTTDRVRAAALLDLTCWLLQHRCCYMQAGRATRILVQL